MQEVVTRIQEDDVTKGFVESVLDPLRYDYASDDPSEAAGLILKMIRPGARVLDVGCGTGALAELVRDRCCAGVVGIEPNLDRAKLARSRGLEVYNSLLTETFFEKAGSFDVILFADVLEHLPNPASLLRIARAGLRPGGYVVASIPNVAHWSVRFDLLRGRFEYQPFGIMDATHLRWFTVDGVSRLFDSENYSLNQYSASAGAALPFYHRGPWRWVPHSLRNRFIFFAKDAWPNLFACQHIVKATPA